MAEEISLVESKAAVLGIHEILAVFNLGGQHAARLTAVLGDQRSRLSGRVLADIDLEIVGILGQPGSPVGRREVVERNPVSALLQCLAGATNLPVIRHLVLQFDYHLSGRKQGEVAHQQHGVSAGNEGGAAVAEHAQTDQIERVDGGAGGLVRIGFRARLFRVVANQKLIRDDALVGSQDGLAGDAGNSFFGGSGVRLGAHSVFISHRQRECGL